MTTFGDQLYHLGGVPVGTPLTQGDVYHLKPSSGAAGGGGSVKNACKTYVQAHTLCTADQNDVVYVYAEDNSASGTTDYQSSTLTWSKDGTHLIGVNSGGIIGQRSRIAQLSTATGVSPLVTWSASNSSMENIHVFHGVADATSKVAFSVTGDRNRFYRCHFAGIGNTLMDAAGAASLSITGDENLFEECVIGLDTIGRGSAANSELLFPATGQATRNVFRNCIFLSFADANTHRFMIAGATSLDRFALFENCTFINAIDSTATAMTEAFTLDASQGGSIILKDCALIGATEWDAADTGVILVMGASGIAPTSGIAIEPAV